MSISPEAVSTAFSACVYHRDERKAPDEHRRSKFRVGWEDATVRDKTYTVDALERLTWMNLGYRLGQHFGVRSPEEIDSVWEQVAAEWR